MNWDSNSDEFIEDKIMHSDMGIFLNLCRCFQRRRMLQMFPSIPKGEWIVSWHWCQHKWWIHFPSYVKHLHAFGETCMHLERLVCIWRSLVSIWRRMHAYVKHCDTLWIDRYIDQSWWLSGSWNKKSTSLDDFTDQRWMDTNPKLWPKIFMESSLILVGVPCWFG